MLGGLRSSASQRCGCGSAAAACVTQTAGSHNPGRPSRIAIPELVPSLVAPASNIALAVAQSRMPPEALMPSSAPTAPFMARFGWSETRGLAPKGLGGFAAEQPAVRIRNRAA